MAELEVSPRLTRWIRRSFGPDSAEPVLTALRELPTVAVGRQDVERIQAALVIRTAGRWSAFQDMLVLVNTDWRDALVAAGLAEGDWPRQLDVVLDS